MTRNDSILEKNHISLMAGYRKNEVYSHHILTPLFFPWPTELWYVDPFHSKSVLVCGSFYMKHQSFIYTGLHVTPKKETLKSFYKHGGHQHVLKAGCKVGYSGSKENIFHGSCLKNRKQFTAISLISPPQELASTVFFISVRAGPGLSHSRLWKRRWMD